MTASRAVITAVLLLGCLTACANNTPPQKVLDMLLHPHQFRHRYADRMLAAGMQEGDLMALAGWRSRDMLARYGAGRRTERALSAARRFAA